MFHQTPPQPLTRRAFLAAASRGIAAAALSATAPAGLVLAQQSIDVNLDVKIGQMLMVGFYGSEVYADHPVVQDIRERHLGGVILLDWANNIRSPAQVTTLTAALQSFAPIPMLVSIDQEGGYVARLHEGNGFPATVTHHYLGIANDRRLTYRHTAAMAQTLAQLGINLNLAPVVDVNSNPDNPIIASYERSFSADPAIVSDQASVFIRAHHDQNVLCTIKHFPGHGSSAADSHVGWVNITDTWVPSELTPFNTLIQAGLADVVMTAHVFHADLDPSYPATLSHPIITGMLRNALYYDGVVMADDMLMGAIANYYGLEVALQRAIEAGVDILLFASAESDLTARAHALIKRMVLNGIISEERIDASYQRILRLKSKLDLPMPVTESFPDEMYFPETGYKVTGVFVPYWHRNGGLEQFGYPITDEFVEDGYTVQYFERVRFEYHPEHAGTPYEVLLGPLGRIITADRQHEQPFQRTVQGRNPGPFIAETGHHLAPEFLNYWQQYGGLPIYGYPISEPFLERNSADGQLYMVQYFERARFEYHPQHDDPRYRVLLGMLGVEVLRMRGVLPAQ